MKEVKKAVTHLPPRHLDDFLAVASLKLKHPNAEVEFVHPQKVPAEYYERNDVVLIDVGGVFDPHKRNYDHHQNTALPSSLCMVLENELEDLKSFLKLKTVKTIDGIDRFGFKWAEREGLVIPNERSDEMRRTILAVDLNQAGVLVGSSAVRVLRLMELGQVKDDFNEFVKRLYETLDEQNLLEEAKEKIKKEKREFEEKLKRAKVVSLPEGTKVLITTETLAPRHGEVFAMGYDVIIERNSMNDEHTSVVINTASERAKRFNVKELVEGKFVVFRHPTGFITVVNQRVEDFVLEFLGKKPIKTLKLVELMPKVSKFSRRF